MSRPRRQRLHIHRRQNAKSHG